MAKLITMDVLKWHLMLHRDARDLPAAKEIDAPEMKFADEVFDRLYAGEGATALPEGEQDAKLGEWARSFHQQAEGSSAWQRLAKDCEGDVLASALATEQVIKAVSPTVPKPGPGNMVKQPGGALERAKQGTGTPDKIRRALLTGAAKAEALIDEAREAMDGLTGVGGWQPGNGAGSSSTEMNVAQVKRLLASLQNNGRIKRIAALAGRLKRIAATKRRMKITHGADEVADVEQGSALARLLPSEIVKLANPLLRLALLRDITENRAMQYRLTGKDTKARGPMVVLVDKSGSMNGERDEWATAVALALLAEAQRQRRAFALIPFDSYVKATYIVQPGGSLSEAALMVEADGGTDIPRALAAGLDVIEREGAMRKADIVLITDGGSCADPALLARAKALQTTIIGIGIGVPAEYLRPFTDEAHAIHRLDTIEDAAAESLFAGKEE